MAAQATRPAGRRAVGPGLYRLRTRLSQRREVTDVLVAILFLAVVVFTTLFLVKLPNVSRLFLLLLFVVQAGADRRCRGRGSGPCFVRLRARGQTRATC